MSNTICPLSVYSHLLLCVKKGEKNQIHTPIRAAKDDGEDIRDLFLMQVTEIKTMLLWGFEGAQMEAG